MKGYAMTVMLLRFAVDFLLLLGVCRMSGYPPDWGRVLVGAALGGLYSGICLLPGLVFLANSLWMAAALCIICLAVFGFEKGGLRRSVLFILLQLALNGIGMGLDKGGLWSAAASAIGVFLLCAVGFRGQPVDAGFVPVELSCGGNCVQLLALRDTGNALRDPITGRPVLVVSADVAQRLVGLTREQLKRPVEALSSGKIPGLRLIPYRTVGLDCGMMLALPLRDVRIGKWKGNSLVAFAPEGLDGEYQALTGGAA